MFIIWYMYVYYASRFYRALCVRLQLQLEDKDKTHIVRYISNVNLILVLMFEFILKTAFKIYLYKYTENKKNLDKMKMQRRVHACVWVSVRT